MLKKIAVIFRIKRPVLILLALLIVLANLAFIPKAFAGSLTGASLVELGGASYANPMVASDGQQLAISFTTANAVSSGYYVVLSFGTPFENTVGTAGSIGASVSQVVSNTGCTSLTGASNGLPGTLAVTSTPGSGLITIASTGAGDSLSASTSYCTELTYNTAVINPSSSGTYNVTVQTENSGSSVVDSKTTTIDVLTSTQNNYTVSATVAPTFTMSLSGTTDSFSGNLSSTATTLTSGVTTTINTNASSGWFVWAKDSNAGLTSASTSTNIASVTPASAYTFTSHTGSQNYGLGVSAYNTTAYAYGGGTTGSGLSSSSYNEIATNNTSASGLTFTTHELANISATTPAASDYTDTIYEIGAGSF